MIDYLKLENQVCFPIYALSRQITALYRPHLDKLGLTYPQYLVMMVLWEYKSRTVKELGEMLFLDSGTLTPLLKRMEACGLINRKRSETDERIVNIVITPKGMQLKEKATDIPSKIKEGLQADDEQLSQLKNQLNKMIDSATKCKYDSSDK
ncbi:MarR family winged helix-turn-helix transcriptional regulator [Dysgonomonas macrotermitis]|uniref:DNA-binding transcriptional regulator, MarR family n=1 Tax=Dysgonomonas macrotermitis TaxID=1346286 RepID=A0A1M4X2B4_9BACT|nr:MarR family transcriptional regulator [Dysgonomonas macrotermitis]SHE87641.1 DNA-binding transcriptional regulator, MarR family [Dysgonomonas macrotermitis]